MILNEMTEQSPRSNCDLMYDDRKFTKQ